MFFHRINYIKNKITIGIISPIFAFSSFSTLFNRGYENFTCTKNSPNFFENKLNISKKIKLGFSSVISKAECKQPLDLRQNYSLQIFMGGVGKEEKNDQMKKYEIKTDETISTMLESFGEDACFVLSSHPYSFLGVADGVGGYRELGIDPSIFSFTLMKLCLNESYKLVDGGSLPNCKNIISTAYQELLKLKNPIYGGSTICLSYFDHNTGDFHISNLGDSKLLIIQKSEGRVVIFREQQHYFNCPFQLSNNPGSRCSDMPDTAIDYSFKLNHGDIILIGTDGFFDNVFNEYVTEVTTKYLNKMDNLSSLYNTLLESARQFSLDPSKTSPFGIEYYKQKKVSFTGGKSDDITLIMAVVSENKSNQHDPI